MRGGLELIDFQTGQLVAVIYLDKGPSMREIGFLCVLTLVLVRCSGRWQLLFAGDGRNGLHVGGKFLQASDGRGIELVQGGLIVALGREIVARFGNQNFLDALAVVGGDRYFDGWRGESGVDELACGQFANFVDQKLDA